MEEPQRVEQKRRVFPLQSGDIKKCFGFSQTNCFSFFVCLFFFLLFFFLLLTGPDRCIFFSTCKQFFTEIPTVLLVESALHVHSFSQWVSMLPQIIDKIVETSDGPSSYARLCVNNLYWWHTADRELRVQNVKSSLALFESLGFVVHPTKSVLTPSHKIIYLGLEIDSTQMAVVPTLERKQKILSTCSLQNCCLKHLYWLPIE